jgi:hypothetical protein
MTSNIMKHLINFDLILSSTEPAKIQNQEKHNIVVQGQVLPTWFPTKILIQKYIQAQPCACACVKVNTGCIHLEHICYTCKHTTHITRTSHAMYGKNNIFSLDSPTIAINLCNLHLLPTIQQITITNTKLSPLPFELACPRRISSGTSKGFWLRSE